MKVWPGRPHPFGATWDGGGVNFALFSEHATRVDLWGRLIRGAGVQDITWLDPGGSELSDLAWNAPHLRSFAVRLNGRMMDEIDERGEAVEDDTFLVCINVHDETVAFKLPEEGHAFRWAVALDTAESVMHAEERIFAGGAAHDVGGRSLVVFRLAGEEEEPPRRGTHPRG